MKRKWIITAVIIIAVLIVIFAVIPSLINANKYRPEIESRISAALGRKVTIGNLSFSLWSGSVQAQNIRIADDPAFARAPFIQAKQLNVGVEIWPLLTSHQINITSLTLQQPDVNLIENASGRWNFSSLGKSTGTTATPPSSTAPTQHTQAQAKPAPSQPAPHQASSSAPPPLSVGSLNINNGRISVSTIGGKPHQYSGVNASAKNVSYNSRFPFTVSAMTPGGGKAKLDGEAGPIDQQDTALTPLDANVNITNLNLAQTGFMPPSSGISGVMDFSGKLASNNGVARSEGTAKAEKLQVVKNGAPSSIPVTVDYASDYNLRSQAGKLNKGDIHLGNGLARLTGEYALKGQSPDLHMNLAGQGIPIGDITGLLPAVGVSLPSGSSLQGGTASANLNFNGALDRLITTGSVHVDNTKLAGFSMGSQLAAVAKLAGIQQTSDTTIKLLATNVNMGPEGTQLSNIDLVVPELGTVTGSGVISPNNALDLNLVAKLSNAAASATRGVASLVGVSGKAIDTLPFKVEGTTSKPVFIPNIGGMLAGGASKGVGGLLGKKAGSNQNQNPVQNVLGGILGKKKPQQ
jgi:AsmA protein